MISSVWAHGNGLQQRRCARCGCRYRRRSWRGSVAVDLHTKCIKLADRSQTIWLILSYSSPSEQWVEGRDQWHNGLRQTAAQTICGDNPDAIRAIMAPFSQKQTRLYSRKGKVSFLVDPFSMSIVFVSTLLRLQTLQACRQEQHAAVSLRSTFCSTSARASPLAITSSSHGITIKYMCFPLK